MKRVNTTNPLVLTDEDCMVQSDVGKKLTYKKTIYTKTQTIRKKPTKKAELLAIPDVKRWYDNVARGSPVSAEINLRRLSKFCEDNKITPTHLAELGITDVRKVTDLLQDQISWMESQGKAPQYIKGTITAIKSWLHHFDVF
ncbi:MAG: hypothetical protein KGI28_10410, partial [Thaumarchaeota archaeon]|nr:hypothetical protein [Nitrososphaerota archaeon]